MHYSCPITHRGACKSVYRDIVLEGAGRLRISPRRRRAMLPRQRSMCVSTCLDTAGRRCICVTWRRGDSIVSISVCKQKESTWASMRLSMTLTSGKCIVSAEPTEISQPLPGPPKTLWRADESILRVQVSACPCDQGTARSPAILPSSRIWWERVEEGHGTPKEPQGDMGRYAGTLADVHVKGHGERAGAVHHLAWTAA
ncbi:hypothetical protein BD289DRAFT_32799 [Coniella lustricola]|uniref:Uncharacterized protein n=1 Tax=Coniella lustricola TaxID=2025994 RepID=A0A2T3A2R4_9PEZI|nr:hypothetical protein BD289DRAFT_32799 [Coniella lustricola]